MHPDPQYIYTRNIRVFYITEFFRSLSFFIPIWVAYELQYITISQLALLEAIIMGFQLVSELPTGAFADLFGKRVSVIIGNILVMISLAIYACSRSFDMFLVYALISGIGGSFISGAQEALLYDTCKEAGKEDQFSKINAKMGVIFQVGLAFAIVVGGLLGSLSFAYPLWMTTGAVFLCCIVCFFFIEPFIDTEKFTVKRYIAQTKEGVKELLKTPYIKKISLFYILIGTITWTCVMIFSMALLTELKFSVMELGIEVALIRVINSFIVFRVLHIDKLLTKKRTFLFFPILMMIALLPGIFFTKYMALVAVAFITLASTSRWIILGKYTNEEFDSKNRATAISTLSMAIGILYVIIVYFSGPVMEHFGGTRTIFTCLGVLTALFILPLGIHLAKHHS